MLLPSASACCAALLLAGGAGVARAGTVLPNFSVYDTAAAQGLYKTTGQNLVVYGFGFDKNDPDNIRATFTGTNCDPAKLTSLAPVSGINVGGRRLTFVVDLTDCDAGAVVTAAVTDSGETYSNGVATIGLERFTDDSSQQGLEAATGQTVRFPGHFAGSTISFEVRCTSTSGESTYIESAYTDNAVVAKSASEDAYTQLTGLDLSACDKNANLEVRKAGTTPWNAAGHFIDVEEHTETSPEFLLSPNKAFQFVHVKGTGFYESNSPDPFEPSSFTSTFTGAGCGDLTNQNPQIPGPGSTTPTNLAYMLDLRSCTGQLNFMLSYEKLTTRLYNKRVFSSKVVGTMDLTAPTVTSWTSNPVGPLLTDWPTSFVIAFSETVQSLDTSKVGLRHPDINGGATTFVDGAALTSTVASATVEDVTTLTFTPGDRPIFSAYSAGPVQGNVEVVIAAGAVQDVRLNANVELTHAYTVDSIHPELATMVPAAGTAVSQAPAKIVLDFSEPVKFVDENNQAMVFAHNDAESAFVQVPLTDIFPTSPDGQGFFTQLELRNTATSVNWDGTVRVQVTAGAVQDAFANMNLDTDLTYTLDTTPPSIVTRVPKGPVRPWQPTQVLTFSETITLVDASKLKLATGDGAQSVLGGGWVTVKNGNELHIDTSNAAYDAFRANGDDWITGDIVRTLLAGAVQDHVGNLNTQDADTLVYVPLPSAITTTGVLSYGVSLRMGVTGAYADGKENVFFMPAGGSCAGAYSNQPLYPVTADGNAAIDVTLAAVGSLQACWYVDPIYQSQAEKIGDPFTVLQSFYAVQVPRVDTTVTFRLLPGGGSVDGTLHAGPEGDCSIGEKVDPPTGFWTVSSAVATAPLTRTGQWSMCYNADGVGDDAVPITQVDTRGVSILPTSFEWRDLDGVGTAETFSAKRLLVLRLIGGAATGTERIFFSQDDAVPCGGASTLWGPSGPGLLVEENNNQQTPATAFPTKRGNYQVCWTAMANPTDPLHYYRLGFVTVVQGFLPISPAPVETGKPLELQIYDGAVDEDFFLVASGSTCAGGTVVSPQRAVALTADAKVTFPAEHLVNAGAFWVCFGTEANQGAAIKITQPDALAVSILGKWNTDPVLVASGSNGASLSVTAKLDVGTSADEEIVYLLLKGAAGTAAPEAALWNQVFAKLQDDGATSPSVVAYGAVPALVESGEIGPATVTIPGGLESETIYTLWSVPASTNRVWGGYGVAKSATATTSAAAFSKSPATKAGTVFETSTDLTFALNGRGRVYWAVVEASSTADVPNQTTMPTLQAACPSSCPFVAFGREDDTVADQEYTVSATGLKSMSDYKAFFVITNNAGKNVAVIDTVTVEFTTKTPVFKGGNQVLGDGSSAVKFTLQLDVPGGADILYFCYPTKLAAVLNIPVPTTSEEFKTDGSNADWQYTSGRHVSSSTEVSKIGVFPAATEITCLLLPISVGNRKASCTDISNCADVQRLTAITSYPAFQTKAVKAGSTLPDGFTLQVQVDNDAKIKWIVKPSAGAVAPDPTNLATWTAGSGEKSGETTIARSTSASVPSDSAVEIVVTGLLSGTAYSAWFLRGSSGAPVLERWDSGGSPVALPCPTTVVGFSVLAQSSTEDGFTPLVTLTGAGTAYFVVFHQSAVPAAFSSATKAEKSQQILDHVLGNAAIENALKQGQYSVPAGSTPYVTSFSAITGLRANSRYDIWACAQDSQGVMIIEETTSTVGATAPSTFAISPTKATEIYGIKFDVKWMLTTQARAVWAVAETTSADGVVSVDPSLADQATIYGVASGTITDPSIVSKYADFGMYDGTMNFTETVTGLKSDTTFRVMFFSTDLPLDNSKTGSQYHGDLITFDQKTAAASFVDGYPKVVNRKLNVVDVRVLLDGVGAVIWMISEKGAEAPLKSQALLDYKTAFDTWSNSGAYDGAVPPQNTNKMWLQMGVIDCPLNNGAPEMQQATITIDNLAEYTEYDIHWVPVDSGLKENDNRVASSTFRTSRTCLVWGCYSTQPAQSVTDARCLARTGDQSGSGNDGIGSDGLTRTATSTLRTLKNAQGTVISQCYEESCCVAP